MYVTCEQCRTMYRLDDGLVKESGTKVRCSKCKFIFFVYPEKKTQLINQIGSEGAESRTIPKDQSCSDHFTDEDLRYLQERKSRIKGQRVNFDAFFQEEGLQQKLDPHLAKNDRRGTPGNIDDTTGEDQKASDEAPPGDDNTPFDRPDGNTQIAAADHSPGTVSISDRTLPTVDEQTDPFFNYDDDEQIENCKTGNKASDVNLLEDRTLPDYDEIPSVPVLDDDFENSGYERAHYREDWQDQYEWNEFDYEPDEFDENIRPPEHEVVDTDKEVPGEDRSFQMAMEIGEQYEWGREEVKLLARVFYEHGWSLTRNYILRELELGMTFDEFQLAVKIREIWHSHTEFSIGYSLKGSFGDDSLKYRSVYKNPAWSLCLKIIRKFDSRPDPEEIEQHFLTLFSIWKFSSELQDRHITYYGFIKEIVNGDDASLDMLVWQYSYFGEIEGDYPNGW
jgi:predicted Zn finger-like uncharacterized protein